MSDYWVDKLFLTHPELFAKVLERSIPQAVGEAEWIAQTLKGNGVKSGSRVLDLACGIGRHSIELARLGYRVTGVDLSPAYVSRAKELAKERRVQRHTNFLVGDMRQIAKVLDGQRFDAVINLFTSFGFYDDKTDVRVLKQCRELVCKKGLFLMDTINRDGLAKNFQPQGLQRLDDIVFLEERVLNQERGRMNTRWTILREIKKGRYEQRAVIDLDHRVYALHELIDIFKKAGWKYREAYGSLTGAPLEVASRRLVALFANERVARHRGSEWRASGR